MIKTFGAKRQFTDGLLAPIHWPQLAMTDTRTGDGRLLKGNGGDTRELPVTVYFQFAQTGGHDGAVAVGTLDYVVFDDDENIVSGDGWLIDTDDARLAHKMIATGALARNSVDLTEIEYEIELTEDFDLIVDFTKWSIGATTFVGKSAFPNARGEVGEIVASADNPPLVIGDTVITTPADRRAQEVSASAATAATVDAAPFFRPEATEFTKIVLDEDGNVYGHLGAWGSCHEGIDGQCITIPRSRDAYAGFMSAGPLVEFEDGRRAQIETGPIALAGGHAKYGLSREALKAAYDDPTNVWADVRVIDGAIGPWLAGRVRPGITEEQIYAARASRISGHWKDGELLGIISVNTPGYKSPGNGNTRYFAHQTEEHLELVASFAAPECCSDCATSSDPLDQEVEGPVDFTEFHVDDLATALLNHPDFDGRIVTDETIEADPSELEALRNEFGIASVESSDSAV